MQEIIDRIKAKFPELTNVRVGFAGLEKNRELAIKLFDMGATVYVSDPDVAVTNTLNRVMYERSGSMYRYKAVAFEGINREVLDILITEQEPEKGSTCNAKFRVQYAVSTDGGEANKSKDKTK
jgi:hypothetical protein